jgi:hypothetical protein
MKASSAERLNDYITELSNKASLDSWNSFVEELRVPGDIAPMLTSGRHQLRPPGRALTAEECEVLYRLIGGLVETNAALRQHAHELAHLMHIWTDAFKQLHTVGYRIQQFANFKRTRT